MGKGIKVIELGKDRYTVVAAADDRKGKVECGLLGFIERCLDEKQYHGAATGLFKLIEIFAADGSEGLTTDQSHFVDQQHKIYQLKKGDLRVLYFYADDKSIVICSHGFIKSSKKADKKEVSKALKLQKEYFKSKKLDFLQLDN
ncbi:MAG: hypothetical protein ACI92B_001471 [Marinobacter maritimus]